MKNLLTIVFVFAAFFSNAQDCSKYYYLQNNRVITMGIYDKKNNVNGKVVYTVNNLAGDSASVSSEMFSSKGKSMGKGNSVIKCNNGMIMVDMKLMMPPQQSQSGPMADATASASGSYLNYPLSLNVGDQLPDGSFNVTTNNGGPASSINMDILNRKVDSKESVTTPAGTWDCYKITYNSKMKIKTGPFGLPSMNFDVAEWYVPGFGVVKTESKYGTTMLVSIQ